MDPLYGRLVVAVVRLHRPSIHLRVRVSVRLAVWACNRNRFGLAERLSRTFVYVIARTSCATSSGPNIKEHTPYTHAHSHPSPSPVCRIANLGQGMREPLHPYTLQPAWHHHPEPLSPPGPPCVWCTAVLARSSAAHCSGLPEAAPEQRQVPASAARHNVTLSQRS